MQLLAQHNWNWWFLGLGPVPHGSESGDLVLSHPLLSCLELLYYHVMQWACLGHVSVQVATSACSKAIHRRCWAPADSGQPSPCSQAISGRQHLLLNPPAFPFYYWISKGKELKTEMLFALLHETCMHFSLLVFDFVSLPKTELLGQHERQLTRSGICIGVWLKIFSPLTFTSKVIKYST